MKKIVTFTTFFTAALLLLMSCSDLGDPISVGNGNGGGNGGGGGTVSYTDDIDPIFEDNCATSGCHSGQFPAGQLDLTSYAGLMDDVGPNAPVVTAGNPDGSPLVRRIEGTQSPRMPLGDDALKASEIDLIRVWITEGALDN